MPMRTIAPTLAAALASTLALAAEPTVVAVFDLELSGLQLKPAERAGLDEYLRGKIAQRPELSVIPPSEIRSRLRKEKAESYRACYDEACQIEIGKELAAQTSVSTKILKLGAQCTVSVVFYDLRRAASAQAADATGGCSVSALARSIESAVLKLSRKEAPRTAERRGVVDPERCPLPDTRRDGAPPPEGRRYSCVNADNRPHGPTVDFHANGQRQRTTEYRDGLAHGPMQEWHANGKVQQTGQHTRGKKTGTWTYALSSGVKVREGPYVDGVKSGEWSEFHGQQGYRTRVDTYRADLRDGPSKVFRQDGSLSAEGAHRGGNQSGLWTYYRDDGKRHFTQAYVDGMRQGLRTKYDAEGRVESTQEYAKGDANGVYEGWDDDDDGKRYLEVRAHYRDDKLHGKRTYFDAKGRITSEQTYARGKRDGPFKRYAWTTSGERYVAQEGTWAADKKSGLWTTRRAPGVLQAEETMRNSRRHGLVRAYYGDGTLKSEAQYRDGRQHGKAKVFDADGRRVRTETWSEGRKVKSVDAPRAKQARAKVAVLGALGSGSGGAVSNLFGPGGASNLDLGATHLDLAVRSVRGGLGALDVSRVLQGGRGALMACVPPPTGRHAAELTVSPAGEVTRAKPAARRTGGSAWRCIGPALKKLSFPKATKTTRFRLELTYD